MSRMHYQNDLMAERIINLEADRDFQSNSRQKAEAENERLKGDIKEMVRLAAEKNLDGYRELGNGAPTLRQTETPRNDGRTSIRRRGIRPRPSEIATGKD